MIAKYMRDFVFVGLFFCNAFLFSASNNSSSDLEAGTAKHLKIPTTRMSHEEVKDLVTTWNGYLSENPEEFKKLVWFFDHCSTKHMLKDQNINNALRAELFFGQMAYLMSHLLFYFGPYSYDLKQHPIIIFCLMFISYICYKEIIAKEQGYPGVAFIVSLAGLNPLALYIYGLVYKYWIGEVALLAKLIRDSDNSEYKKTVRDNIPDCLIQQIDGFSNFAYNKISISPEMRPAFLAFIRNGQDFFKVYHAQLKKQQQKENKGSFNV